MPEIIDGAIFERTHPYNVLPQFFVDSKSTASFQCKLQTTLTECVASEHPEWESLLRTEVYNQDIRSCRSWVKMNNV